MALVLKYILLILGILVSNLLLVGVLNKAGLLTVVAVTIIVFEIVLVISYITFVKIVKPLSGLYDALNIIDFDKDVIDFSKLDCLELTGFKEIKVVLEKFKYLLDIITERINRVNSETYKSEHDGLTGCYNRLRLDNIKSTYEFAQMFAVIFIDVNNLKRMNDEFGHEAGDALLKQATQKLNFWNTYGDVYRMGGDEFMIVLLNKQPQYVEKLVNQWYPTVGQLNRATDGFKCVLSYGISYGTKGCSFDAVQKQADDRMYDMKVALKKKFGEPLR